MRVLSEIVAIHEDVFSSRMPMQIAIKHKLPLFRELPDQLFDAKVYRVQDFVRRFPSSIEILAAQRTSIVSVDNAIGIQYRYYLEHEMLPKGPSFRTIANQKLDDALHHPRGIAFTGVYSGADEYTFLGHRFSTFRILIFAGNRQIFASVSRQSSREGAFVEEVLGALDFLNAIEVFLEIGIGVRETVCKKLLVIFVGKSMSECQAVICPEKSVIVTSVLVGNISYLFTNSVPSHTFRFFNFIRKTQNFHAVIVQRIWFR